VPAPRSGSAGDASENSIAHDPCDGSSQCICVVLDPWTQPWRSTVPEYNVLVPPCVQHFLYLVGRRAIPNPGGGDCWFHASQTFTGVAPEACRSFVSFDARVRQCVGAVLADQIARMGTPTSTEHICIAMKALRYQYLHGLLVINAPMCAGIHFEVHFGHTTMRLPEALACLRSYPTMPTMLFLRDGPSPTIGHFVACPLVPPFPPPSEPPLPPHARHCCNFHCGWDMLGGGVRKRNNTYAS